MQRIKLLSVSQDSKTIKGQKLGVLTGILYLAPLDIAGRGNVCPGAALAGCGKACLYTAGRGVFNNVQKARIAKTKLFFDNRELFFDNLILDIQALIKKAQKLGLTKAVRLNGTSDVAYENIKIQGDKTIFDLFPEVQFYDYTKIPTRKNIPANYDLTFSYSGLESYQPLIKKALLNDKLKRIAVVFKNDLPDTFLDRRVIDGDSSDIRFSDPSGVIVGLKAKGKARQDQSGFIVNN